MNLMKTFFLGIFALVFTGGIYFWLFKNQASNDSSLEKIIYLQKDQINYLELVHKDKKYVFQKNDQQWSIEEPIVDTADQNLIDQVLTQLTTDSQLIVALDNVAQESMVKNWSEYGLDAPESRITLKNNLGQSQKIFLSQQKNFEGQHYAKIDNINKVILVNPAWFNYTTEKLTYFRKKSLYRGQAAAVKKVYIKSLGDEFTLTLTDQGWISPDFESYILDQNKVRAMIKSIAENTIQEYISEGDPSDLERYEKGLTKDFVTVIFESETDKWSVAVNINEKDNSLYALTDRPTYLVKLDLSQWELFGNLNLDALRDRKKLLVFENHKVEKIFIKKADKKIQVIKKDNFWFIDESINDSGESQNSDLNQLVLKFPDQDMINQLIDQAHNLEITYFLEGKQADGFLGKDMIILKTSDDQLLFQLNWGPERSSLISGKEQKYYLARTQASDSIFGLDQAFLNDLSLDLFFKMSDKIISNKDNELKKDGP